MVRLGDVCKKASSNIAQKDLEEHSGKYPIYGASGLIKHVDFYQQEQPYIAVVKDGAGIGRIMKLPAKSSVIGTMQYIIPNDIVDISYLAYAMEYMNLSKYFSGATIPHIYFKDYQKETLPLPPLDEQRRIAATLDKVSDLISKRRQQLDKLDELVKARFVEMFGDPQNNEKNWKMRTFKDIFTVRQGLQIPISKRLTHFEENCYEYITVAYLHGVKEKEYIKNPKSTVICTKDDILMTRTGNTGMVITNVAGVFHNNFFLIDFDRDKYIKEFLVEYLNLDLIQTELKKRAGTSTIPDLNHNEFYKIAIYEPSINLQNQFAIFVNQTEKAKTTIRCSLEKLETLKKALMQEYFG